MIHVRATAHLWLVAVMLAAPGCAELPTISDVVTFATPAVGEVVENIPTDTSNPFSWLLVGAGAVAAGAAALRKKRKK